jgi:hypothetical protein
MTVIDPESGRRYLIAVEAVRDVDAGTEVTGRVIRPRRYRGNIVTARVTTQARPSHHTTTERPA